MKRDEWLNTLAMKLPEWRKTWEMPDGFAWDGMETITFTQTGDVYTRADWLERRIELIKCPLDSEAPEWAAWKAQDRDGQWHWYEIKPSGHDSNLWMIDGDGVCEPASEGCVPAGHRWEETLTEVNQCAYTAEEDAAWAEKEAQLNGAKLAVESETWSGLEDGLPPVGTVCRIEVWSGEWRLLDEDYRIDYMGERVVVATTVGTKREVERVFDVQIQFKPRTSLEQRARDAIQCAAGDSQMLTLYQARKVYAAIRDGKIPGVAPKSPC